MSTSRVASLTERALINPTVLDWINPPNCEKLKIQQGTDSILKTLLETKQDIYMNPRNNGYWHWSTKPIKAAVRVFYTISVICLISPLGIVGFGIGTIGCLAKYLWVSLTGSGTHEAEWQGTNQYAKAFFTDLTSTLDAMVCSLQLIIH